jgi:hypothetical protein
LDDFHPRAAGRHVGRPDDDPAPARAHRQRTRQSPLRGRRASVPSPAKGGGSRKDGVPRARGSLSLAAREDPLGVIEETHLG